MAFYEYYRSNPSVFKTVMSNNRDFSFPLHFHTSFELLYVQAGEIEVVVGKQTYLAQEGMLILIPPDAAHSYRTPLHSEISISIFHTNCLPELYEEMKAGEYRFPIIPNSESLFGRLKEAQGNVYLFRAALYHVAAAYVQNRSLGTATGRGDDFALVFSEYIEKHFAEPLCEKTVAKALGYHPRYLSCLVRKSFAASFCQVLNDYRIREACTLLRASTKSVTDVYLSVGFDSQSSFNRNFKAIMGVTPLAYRKGYLIGRKNHTN